MSVTEQDWREEQQRVDRVIHEIDKRIVGLQQDMSEIGEDIVDIRTNFWDDVSVNMSDPDDLGETSIALKQQAELLGERERTRQVAHKQLVTMHRLRQSPYFGRIDFAEDGEAGAEQIYLGIGSLIDDSGENFLVYDWRAPLSSLYYDYSPGPAEYDTPGGEIHGTMELKRQFMIRSGHIHSLFDTGVTIGDELLQEVLGKHADAQMRSIVATIQKEQNLIIRNERSRLLIVQGAAGSGKTSAALQRVAYLLYRYREFLSANQIVLFSPNTMFNSYISTVLPELGEENMQQTTLQGFLEHRLGKMFDLEDPFQQMEYVLTAMNEPGYEARIEAMQYKASTAYMGVLERYVEWLAKEGLIFRGIKFQGEVLISSAEIRERFYAMDQSLKLPNRMKLLSDELMLRLEELEKTEREKPWVDDEIELLDKDEYVKAYQQLRRGKKSFRESSFDDFDRERDALATMVVKRKFKPLRNRVKRLGFVNMPAVYRQLFLKPELAARFAEGELPRHWPEICAHTVGRLEQGELNYEDATPFLYVKERIEGVQTNNLVRHVFVDEAQDYSAFQFHFLKRLFPRAKMTVLGDLNQSIYAHAVERDPFEPLHTLYDAEETETIILRRSYRSTRPIIEFTRCMVESGDKIEPFNREGSLPRVTYVDDEVVLHAKIIARIQALREEGHQNIAVICKTSEESKGAFEKMKDALPMRQISKETISFENGVVVIPSYLAKGVEFDAVILYNASAERYGRESERRLFYTACTRAMHELDLYSIGEVSPFVSDAAAGTYVMEG
jgi:DNA helicase II / ATP-dependent DNA helicase PcrA